MSAAGTLSIPTEFLQGVERLDRRDRRPLLALFILALLSNLIPAQTSFYNSDQAELAYALQDYDVGVEHPHPPGNPVFVACAKVVYLLTGNALVSLLVVTGALRIGAILGLYWLAALLYGRLAALAASSLWLFFPPLWSVGVSTFTWAADAFFAVVIAATALKALRGSDRYAILSACLIAVGMGFRESLFLLGPLWLFCVWRRPRRVVVLAVLAAALIVALWVTGMIVATGGWDRYMTSRSALMSEVVKPTTVLLSGEPIQRLLANSARLTDCIIGYGSKVLALVWLLPMVYAVGRAFSIRSLLTDDRARFILLWWLPPVAFYVLFHIVHIAHILIFLPAWLIAAGVGFVLIVGDCQARAAARPPHVLIGLMIVFALGWNLGGIALKARPDMLRWQTETDDIVNYTRDHFRPEESLLVQADVRRQFRAVMYRLPDFEGVILQQTFGDTARPSMSVASPIKLGPAVEYLVIPEVQARVFVPTEGREFRSGAGVRWRRLAADERYVFFDRRGLWTSARPDQTEPPAPAPIPATPAAGP